AVAGRSPRRLPAESAGDGSRHPEQPATGASANDSRSHAAMGLSVRRRSARTGAEKKCAAAARARTNAGDRYGNPRADPNDNIDGDDRHNGDDGDSATVILSEAKDLKLRAGDPSPSARLRMTRFAPRLPNRKSADAPDRTAVRSGRRLAAAPAARRARQPESRRLLRRRTSRCRSARPGRVRLAFRPRPRRAPAGWPRQPVPDAVG